MRDKQGEGWIIHLVFQRRVSWGVVGIGVFLIHDASAFGGGVERRIEDACERRE